MGRRAFHTIAARGLEHLRGLPGDRPVLLFCNHTNWWDGLICYFLTKHMLPRKAYCMMEEKQLQHHRLFARLGAFSVDLDHPVSAAVSLRYAKRLLKKNETALWIFPQGKLCRPDEPIEIKPGAYYLAQSTPQALLIPLAIRYEFFREDRPNALIEIGEPLSCEGLREERIAQDCEAAFARVSLAAAQQNISGFTRLFPPLWPINKRWEWVKRVATGRLSGFNPNN